MKKIRLGNTGLQVSRLALGCMSFGKPALQGTWTLEELESDPLIKQALDLGINFWDTANVYGLGSSEEIIGRAIKKYTRRDDIVLATKLYFPMHQGPGGGGLSRKAIMEQVDASLKRLDTDYIDLYQIHRFDPLTSVEETMEALHDIVKAGKVRYLGASSMWAWQFSKMQYVAERHHWTKFVSMQHQYNLVQREEEREMFGLLSDQGIASLPWSPLAAGLVARPWGASSSTRAQENPATDQQGRPLYLASDKATVDAVESIAAEHHVSMATIAMAWLLSKPGVTSPIIGATQSKHLEDAVAALDVQLSADEIIKLEQAYSPRLPTYF
ncbi:aldo/keto reductase [Dickeya chrysanthemi]|uniref:aldo/keto reductase n=1 Tax=Dickeya chrysanthemi TaxID=556 RepID=UPI0025A206B4|nr:aldo/keto reductase [Dickeya chrysanthemi]WJM84167.1 aldo/keto reductase [Dickeya chrysanthemi]